MLTECVGIRNTYAQPAKKPFKTDPEGFEISWNSDFFKNCLRFTP